MEQLLIEIQSKIESLQNKFNYDKKCRLKHQEILPHEKWNDNDTSLLHDLINVSKYLYTVCYNSVLNDIKQNENSIFENYCELKKTAIMEEIPKHKSKYILKEFKDELEKLERLIQNKDRFIDSKKSYAVSYDIVIDGLSSVQSPAARTQLKKVYFDDSLDSNYKLVLNDLLKGEFYNYNKLGKITLLKRSIREVSDLCNPENLWEINNKVDNILNNKFSKNDRYAYKEISLYLSKFIKYNEYLKNYDIKFPTAQGNYFENVQLFLKDIMDKEFSKQFAFDMKKDLEVLQNELPSHYEKIEYGFFGTTSGTPGVAYYFEGNSDRLEAAKNVKFLCDILLKAKELEGKSLGVDIIEQVNQDLISDIDSKISFKM